MKIIGLEKLLDQVEPLLVKDYQKTAYNFLVDYLENPEWFNSHEGRRLVWLSKEILEDLANTP